MNRLLRPLPWILALALLQPVWHLWLAPSTWLPPAIVVVVMGLPILPALLLALFGRPSAGFWGGVAALLYFSHGVMELWSNPDVTALAWAETLLSVGMVVAASWRGLQARAAARRTNIVEPPAAADDAGAQ